MWASLPPQHNPFNSVSISLSQECTTCVMWRSWRAGRWRRWTWVPLLIPPVLWLDSSQTQHTEWTVWPTTVMEWSTVWRPTPQSPHVSKHQMDTPNWQFPLNGQCSCNAGPGRVQNVTVRGSTVQSEHSNDSITIIQTITWDAPPNHHNIQYYVTKYQMQGQWSGLAPQSVLTWRSNRQHTSV